MSSTFHSVAHHVCDTAPCGFTALPLRSQRSTRNLAARQRRTTLARRGLTRTAASLSPEAFSAASAQAQTALDTATTQASNLMYQLAAAATPDMTALDALPDVDPFAEDPFAAPQRKVDWIQRLADPIEDLLRFIQDKLHAAGVEQAAGISIIAVIVLLKLVTYPTTKTQAESSLAQQNLKPLLDAIKRRYPNNKEKQQAETARVYQETGVNPLAGCLPSLLQLPIFWGLFRALQNASEDSLFNEPFLWIPDLAGPTTAAARQAGTGLAWLWPLTDEGVPPIGSWDVAARYLVLPALIVVAQLISQEVLKPPEDPTQTEEEKQKAETTRQALKFLPFLLGYFALNVPSGLGLYWFANTTSTTLIQVYLRYGGGANPLVKDLLETPKVAYGCAIRTTIPVPRGTTTEGSPADAPPVAADAAAATAEAPAAEGAEEGAADPDMAPGSLQGSRQGVVFTYDVEELETAVAAVALVAREKRALLGVRCKRKREVNQRITRFGLAVQPDDDSGDEDDGPIGFGGDLPTPSFM